MNRAAATTAVAVTLASALTLTACSGSGGSQVSADSKQTLTVWAMGTEGEKLADVAKVYEKANPHISVEVTPIGWDVAHQKLVAAAAAGKLPDVMQMGGSYMTEFADMGALEPVDTETFQEKDYFPAGWEQGSYDGKTYGVPWYVDTRVLYYRTDLAERAGIDKAPATMAELQQVARQYQEKAGTKYGLSIQPNGLDSVQSFYQFLYSAGGEIVTKDGKAVANSPAAVRALENYTSYFTKGIAAKSVRPGYDVTKDFNNGSVPMFFGGPWHMGLLDDNYPGLKGKWAIANVPADKTSASMAGGSSLTVSSDSEHKAAATEFIKYLTGTEGQADWYRRTKDLPANMNAWKSGELATDPAMKVWKTQMDSARVSPSQPKWSEITSKIDTAIEKAAQGKATPKEALDEAQKAIGGLVQ
ncbi:sugar ABC transporter substrate-binding protein [Streptomyces sp. NPDC047725]|uniref:sugar ABC transporter substrate-binding protein n=1 Tax=Streptomyces sp. NPDC047725 TaxID=3365487 RepID=UPI00371382C1